MGRLGISSRGFRAVGLSSLLAGCGGDPQSVDETTGGVPAAVDPCPESTPQGVWSPIRTDGAPQNNPSTRAFWVDGALVVLNLVGDDPGGSYDVCEDAWAGLASPPLAAADAPLGEFAAARAGSRILATMFSIEAQSRGFIYDIEGDAWSELDLGGYRWQRDAELIVRGDQVVVVSPNFPDDIAIVDVATGTLTVTAEGMFTMRQGAEVGPTDAGIYVVGGRIGAEPTADGALLDLASGEWTPIPAGTPARIDDATWVDGRLLVWVGVEGSQEGEVVPENPDPGGAFLYDPASSSWTEVELDGGPQPASYVGLVEDRGHALLFGGLVPSPEGGVDFVMNAASWDPASAAWTQRSRPPSGGCSGSFDLERVDDGFLLSRTCGHFGYDAAADAWIDLGEGYPHPGAINREHVHTGTRWLSWGGFTDEACDDGGNCNPAEYFNVGAIYRP